MDDRGDHNGPLPPIVQGHAQPARVKPNLAEALVDTLRYLLYRDEGTNGGIRLTSVNFGCDRCD